MNPILTWSVTVVLLALMFAADVYIIRRINAHYDRKIRELYSRPSLETLRLIGELEAHITEYEDVIRPRLKQYFK